MVDAALVLLVAHQDSRYEEWGFTGSVRFDPGLAGRGLSLTMTPSFGMASQGADRLWAMQDMGGLIPYGAVPFDKGGQFTTDVGYGDGRPRRPRHGDAVCGHDAVGYGLPSNALRVAVDGGSTVQRGRRGREAGRSRRVPRRSWERSGGPRPHGRGGALGASAGRRFVLTTAGARRRLRSTSGRLLHRYAAGQVDDLGLAARTARSTTSSGC